MRNIIQHKHLSDIREMTYDVWVRTRWHIGTAIDTSVTIPLYRLTGWIAEGRATTIEEDGEAMYRMGFEVGQQSIINPTRAQMVEALEQSGLDASDEHMAKLGFANYPTARQQMEVAS